LSDTSGLMISKSEMAVLGRNQTMLNCYPPLLSPLLKKGIALELMVDHRAHNDYLERSCMVYMMS
jgi:hypothetical protein